MHKEEKRGKVWEATEEEKERRRRGGGREGLCRSRMERHHPLPIFLSVCNHTSAELPLKRPAGMVCMCVCVCVGHSLQSAHMEPGGVGRFRMGEGKDHSSSVMIIKCPQAFSPATLTLSPIMAACRGVITFIPVMGSCQADSHCYHDNKKAKEIQLEDNWLKNTVLHTRLTLHCIRSSKAYLCNTTDGTLWA